MRFAGRSPQELVFRLNQALANLALWAFPAAGSKDAPQGALNLPDPEQILGLLTGSAFHQEIVSLADSIMGHRFPLLGTVIETGPDIDWRRDYVHGKTSGTGYFRFIPYLDFAKVGDHKNIWELNRHQHLVVLAQAHLLTGERRYLDEIGLQLESWWVQNPFLKGINWTSALEVAYRALSWLWIDHLVGSRLNTELRERIWGSLRQHAAFLESNLSTYFSPNTHLLGEAVALHAIGVRFGQKRWTALGAKTVDEELVRQVQGDGSHFEQSTYYHVYALDLFLFHYLIAGRPHLYPPVLRKMARFLASITGPERLLTCFGDDDGGRIFHPYGPRDRFARATLSSCALVFPDEDLPLESEDLLEQGVWWCGQAALTSPKMQQSSRHFPNSGLASIQSGGMHLLMDAGPFGFGGAGHSHADTLSVTARVGSRELLIDPGTFTYIADPKLRNDFRGTGFHNTIRINGLDQAEPRGPFSWATKPGVQVHDWRMTDRQAFLDASCKYRGFTHRRRLLVVGELSLILDEVTGPPGEHLIEQFWHLGDENVRILFADPAAVSRLTGLRSRVLGQKEPAVVLCASWHTALPHLCAVAFSGDELSEQATLKRIEMELEIAEVITVRFGPSGMPSVLRK